MFAESDIALCPDPGTLISRGVRHGNRLLLEEVDRLLPRLDSLDSPLRIVVPSGSLRRHVCSRLVRARRSALLGIQVDTLPGIAREILDRSKIAQGYDFPLEILVARELASQESLKSIPGQAAGSVAATVRDLLDAGLEEHHMEAMEGLLDPSMVGISEPERLRALGLTRIAALIRQSLRTEPFRLDGLDLQAATECLAQGDCVPPLPCSSLIFFGFSDLTGAAGELLSALMGQFGGTTIVDLPPIPGDSTLLEEAYPADWIKRLSAFSKPEFPVDQSAATELDLFVAGEPWIEIHALAERVQAELCQGTPPEEIAIVFRDPEIYRLELRRRFERLGIPFSANAIAGPSDPEQRPWRTMLDLLENDLDPTCERWLSAMNEPSLSPWMPELALAIRVLGTRRLSDLAQLPKQDQDLALPIRDGLVDRASGGPSSPKTRLPAHAIEGLRQKAHETSRLLRSWPASAAFVDHLAQFSELAGLLGWAEIPRGFLLNLARSVPRLFAISRSEFRRVAETALSGLQTKALGGRGGGVQVLTVMEARSRSFSRLFLAGMQRGAFPRPVREDPLLSDALRKQIRALLPDLPIKSLGHDEDRYLFAQLLTAAPKVTLSWPHRVDSKEQLPSPLVESLLRVRLDIVVEAIEPPFQDLASETARPFEEHLMAMALAANHDRLALALPGAWPILQSELPGADIARGASARLDLLAALETPFPVRASILPFLGSIGPVKSSADPRHRGLAVTTVEHLIACPWQTFLTRLLRLEEPPDPLATLPALDPVRLGKVVHRSLEHIFRKANPKERKSGRIRWPAPRELEKLVLAAAEKLLLDEGSSMEGLARGLAHLAMPCLETARLIDWPNGISRLAIDSVETEGKTLADPECGDFPLEFRADRVDREESGLLWTDYKTGKPLSIAKQEKTRRSHLEQAILQGRYLQIVAYCLTGDETTATGRLLFLGEDVQPDHRSIQVSRHDLELISSYRSSVATAVSALSAGALFPRLTGSDGRKEPSRCPNCSVRIACVRGDSGARQDLLQLIEGARGQEPQGAQGNAMVNLWDLPDRKEAKA